MTEYKTELLENTMSIRILLILLKYNGELNKTMLSSMIGPGTNTPARRYNELENAGIVQIKRGRMKNEGHWVTLTDKGKQIAEKLLEIEKIMNEN